MDETEAHAYLESLLNKNLRVFTADGRFFWGCFKCTDPNMNVILANAYEYRQRDSGRQAKSMANATSGTVAVDMTSRFLGMVVVPGKHISKLEVEEFASQMR